MVEVTELSSEEQVPPEREGTERIPVIGPKAGVIDVPSGFLESITFAIQMVSGAVEMSVEHASKVMTDIPANIKELFSSDDDDENEGLSP